MSKLKLGFALEGNSDYPVIPRLAHRIILEGFPHIEFEADSVLRPRKRGHGFVSELPVFARQLQDDGAHVMAAVVDTDDTQVNDRLHRLQQSKECCRGLDIFLCIAEGLAVRKMEAWLLADEGAIFQVYDGNRAGINFAAPEQDPDPKTTLNRLVRSLTEGRELSYASSAEDLANAISLDLLRQRCPHFHDFAQRLTGCVREWERLNAPN